MQVFIAISYNRDNETEIVGVTETRTEALRLVEQARNEIVHFSHHAVDGPNGSVALDDVHGDMVGFALSKYVGGESQLDWHWESESDSLAAPSVYCDGDSAIEYHIEHDGEHWTATFEGRPIAQGALDLCMRECAKSEDSARLDIVQDECQNCHGDVRPLDFECPECNGVVRRGSKNRRWMMTPIDKMCDVMQEAQRGKPVQWRPRMLRANYSNGGPDIPPLDNPWGDDDNPTWNWGACEYRIKPDPRVFWIVEWPTRWHVYQSLDCAIAASRQQIGDVPGQVIRVLEVLDGTD